MNALKGIKRFIDYTGFANATAGNLVMILVGLIFIFLAIRFEYEPLLLIPIGAGILIGNIPFFQADIIGRSGPDWYFCYFHRGVDAGL